MLQVLVTFIVLIPLCLGGITVLISRQNKRLIVQLSGFYAQIILGGLGVIIHELSHLITALIFGHRIVKVKLLHIPDPHNPRDQALGYVNHAWNENSFYQRLGNVLIGIAPVIGCTLAITWLTQWLVPDLLVLWQALIAQTPLPQLNLSLGRTTLWLILMMNIAIGGFDLSRADLENSATGLITLGFGFLISALGLSKFSSVVVVTTWLHTWLSPLYWSMGFALLINLLFLGVLSLLRRLG